jgi:hypothetical protein
MSRNERSAPPSDWYPHAVQIADADVYAYIGATPADSIVWHWCSKRKAWDGGHIVNHTIVSREPLTITASLICLGCGWHGFITDGKWVPV